MAEVFVGPDITGDGVADADITPAGSFTEINGTIFTDAVNTGSGTGNYNTFLAISDNDGAEQGFNSDDTPPIDATNKDIDQAKTHTVKLSDLVIVTIDGVQYYEVRVDLNESNSDPDAQISLDQFKVYTSADGTITSTTTLFSQNLVYDMDAGGNKSVLLSDAESSGSGNDDYAVLIPVTEFDGLDPTETYVYFFIQMGTAGEDWEVNATFEEWNLQNGATLTGTKFEDADGDGIKDDGEGPVEGVKIFIDANQNGSFDDGERFTFTDADGNYSFYGVATGQTVWIDEVVPTGATQTTGAHETVVIGDVAPGTVIVVDPIGNFIPHPAIQVVKEASGYGDCADTVGETITYTYTVTNEGNIALENIVLADDFSDADPVYVSGDDDGDGELDVDETWTYTAEHVVTQEDIDNNGNYDDDGDGTNDSLRNVATVTGDAVDGGEQVTDDDDAIVEVCQDPAIQVVKEASGYGDCADEVGETITYTYTVTNTGNVSLENIELTDDFSDGVPTYVSGDDDGDGELDVDETWIYTAEHVVTQEDIDNNGNYDSSDPADGINDVLRNVAMVTGDAVTTGEEVSDDDDALVEVCQDPAIQVVKEASGYGDCADEVGETITYTYTVTNTGNVSLENIVLSDDYSDADPVYVSGDDDGDGELDVDETWTYTAEHVVTQEDIDNNGNYDSSDPPDGINDSIRNVATVTGDAVTTGTQATDDDDAIVEVCQDPAIQVVKEASGYGDCADTVGETITYTYTVTNTGNVSLENIVLTDDFSDADPVYVSGDDDGDGELDVDETWTYTAEHVVTQEDIDNNGNHDSSDPPDGINDSLRNVATVTGDAVTTGEQVTDDDDAIVEVCQDPAIQVVKEASGYGDCADEAGETITYTYTVTNTGNVSLENIVLSDDYSDADPVYVSGDDDGDGELDVDETWIYTAEHVVTQDDLDDGGNFDSDDPADGINDSIRNVATVTGDAVTTGEQVTDDDDAVVEVCQDPTIDLEKLVSVDSTDGTDGTFNDSDLEWGEENVNIGDPVWFKITLDNTGNVTLTDVDVVDVNTTNGLPGDSFDLIVDGALTADAINNHGATLDGDDDGDGELDVDEVWTITYSQAFDPGNHVNTATVTTAQGATDDDPAHYFSLIDEGPGVRTPGFWQNPNNGGQFWDGIQGNEKNAGEPCFADGELLYAVDSDNDGDIDLDDQKGLLIGDYNKNGLTDAGEDTLFVKYADARSLINASNKQLNSLSGDGKFMLGRDMVATWLNYLAGNNIGDASDDESPHHYLDDAIDWMQIYSGTNAGGTSETFDILKLAGSAIKTSSAIWNTEQSGFDHSASEMHSALDYYNNTGQTEPGGTVYAHDCDDVNFVHAITAISLI